MTTWNAQKSKQPLTVLAINLCLMLWAASAYIGILKNFGFSSGSGSGCGCGFVACIDMHSSEV